MKKLNPTEKNKYAKKIAEQSAAIEANRAYTPVGVYDDNYEIDPKKKEESQYGYMIHVDSKLTAYSHRSLKKDATRCKLVVFEALEDKTINTSSGEKEVKAGTVKMMAYPVA